MVCMHFDQQDRTSKSRTVCFDIEEKTKGAEGIYKTMRLGEGPARSFTMESKLTIGEVITIKKM